LKYCNTFNGLYVVQQHAKRNKELSLDENSIKLHEIGPFLQRIPL